MPSAETFEGFFDDWDHLEATHPFGVMYCAPMFVRHGVDAVLSRDVDQHLFLDLMVPRHPSIRRLKVEGRVQREVFWVYVDLDASLVSFQESPLAPFVSSVALPEGPDDFVRAVMAYFRQARKRGPAECAQISQQAKFGRVE